MAATTPTLFVRARDNVFVRYASALVTFAAAAALSRTLSPSLGDFVPYTLGCLALAFSAWYCGVGPSLMITFLGLGSLKYWFIPPLHSFRISTATSLLGLFLLLIVSAAFIAMGESRRRENKALRHSQGELEERVKQRTAELNTANQGLRELTARLMQLQDEERRRIARELHDSVGQTLAALSMNLSRVSADIERLRHTERTLSDSMALAQDMHREIRTVSYLLHPPLLDEAGLESALRWYVAGFSERSKIRVSVDIPEDFGRAPQDVETALFRTVQECLTNIHRHSGSSVAAVRLSRSANEIRLKVSDRGTGIPIEKLDEVTSDGAPGVGIRGMRERMRQLGGQLELHSSENGTSVEAWLPITQPSLLLASDVAA